MSEEKKFIGVQYPIMKSPRGLLAQKFGTEQIKADLLQLLLTYPGERVMMPTFGTPLRDLIFEQNDQSLAIKAKKMISDAISMWEPRIVVQNIEVSTGVGENDSRLHKEDDRTELERILMISIEFVDPEDITKVEELVLKVPMG